MMMISNLIRLIIISAFAALESSSNNCPVKRCGHHGPKIRFPFWLKDQQHHTEHCSGYPGFGLSCTQTNDTMLELPFPLKAPLLNQTNLPISVKFVIKENRLQITIAACFRSGWLSSGVASESRFIDISIPFPRRIRPI
ncbi:hypothetical protein ACH5RR_038776 [Cinchona calisaya]|uniref:RING-type E3 ubiquitin transferase n=1 Tax=Cinchona calisaya TaxID=153742 RepID=A0ABD2Y1W1_9GENT